MLHLHHADELEPLVTALAGVFAEAPDDPFTPEVVVVPAAGMEDAVKVGLGRLLGATGHGDGIATNIEFMFPGRFVARALGEPDGDDAAGDPWRLPPLTWWVLQTLSATSIPVPGRTASGGDLWSLARRVADLFDRYATQRPSLVQHWAAGRPFDGTLLNGEPAQLEPQHRWQFELWRELRARIGTESPPERLPRLLDDLRSGAVHPALPARVSVFGVGAVPPAMFTVLRALGEQREVHVFLRQPSHVAWGDEAGQGLAGSLSLRANVDVARHVRHPLTASWGRPSLEARALLGGAPEVRYAPEGRRRTVPPATTLLGELQRAIRLDAPPDRDGQLRLDLAAADGTLQVHACHGVTRQLEALRDALGHAFATDPTLEPHDVLVLCPALDRVAPLVEAVLGRGALPVPVRIGDRSLTTDDPVGGALAEVLSLVSGRAALSDVLGLVQFEPVRRRFGWTLDDVEQLADWCVELGTRWGLTADRRPDWGVSADVVAGTWQAMVDQLLAGMVMPAPEPRQVLGDVAPFDDVGTDEFALVGGLAELLSRLVRLHADTVGHTRTAIEWVDLLHDTLDAFCAVESDDAWRLVAVHRALDTVREAAVAASAGATPPQLSLDDVRALLGDTLRDRPGRLPLRSGAVTVSSMVPQHGVPARVVCLVGLDDGTLRGGTFDGDDVLGVHPCVGERHPRLEGRQLLLDAVLAAQERLVITCDGADVNTNKEIPFVVPLVELLDVVREMVSLEVNGSPVVVRHPRHGFDERALLDGGLWHAVPGPFTFDPTMVEAAEARRAAAVARRTHSFDEPTPWALPPVARDLSAGPSGVPVVRTVDELVRALTVPAKVYLQDRLDVSTPRETVATEDHLPLSATPLQQSGLGRELLEARRRGTDADDWWAVAQLDGTLPPGALSAVVLDGVRTEVGEFESAAATQEVPLQAHTVSCDIDVVVPVSDGLPRALHVVGRVSGLLATESVDGAVVRMVPAKLADVRYTKERGSFRLAAAVRLAALQLQLPDEDCSVVLVCRPAGSAKTLPVYVLRLHGDGEERLEHARQVLRLAAVVHDWASRDAVPLFERLSIELVEGGSRSKVDGAWRGDRFEDVVRTLWPDDELDVLMAEQVSPLDPEPMQWIGGSRAQATAEWVWRSFAMHVDCQAPNARPRRAKKASA
ncbi:MAG: exodeoxyribonuclease V subunit gamma [Ilumatobacteraceae bacterium]